MILVKGAITSLYVTVYFCIGTRPEDQRLPGTNCFTKLKMQNAGSEGQACHNVTDSE